MSTRLRKETHARDSALRRRFARILFAYYRKEGRMMAWRATRDPYRILVSEIMLQQTQVDRVRGKYDEFLGRFPTVEALARAPLGDVLRAWSGLGYNRRAKHLHECAKAVVARGGIFPRSMEDLMELPGIGRSTAAGVMAFSWNAPEPMIDTNVRRVLSRVFFGGKTPSDSDLYALAKTLIPKGKGRIWNYAMLDLAAARCTARNHSAECPLALLHGAITEAPRARRSAARFEASDRYARGRIIHVLRERSRADIRVLQKAAERPKEKTAELLLALAAEGLVVRSGNGYALP